MQHISQTAFYRNHLLLLFLLLHGAPFVYGFTYLPCNYRLGDPDFLSNINLGIS